MLIPLLSKLLYSNTTACSDRNELNLQEGKIDLAQAPRRDSVLQQDTFYHTVTIATDEPLILTWLMFCLIKIS